MLLVLLVFLQAASGTNEIFTYMPLETVFKTWITKNAAVIQGKDSVLAPNRIGKSVVRTYRTNTSTIKMVHHLTEKGQTWDAGLFVPSLHQSSLENFSDFVHVTERIALAAFFGDPAYGQTVMTLSDIEINSGVGDAQDRVKAVFESMKGYTNTVQVKEVSFKDGLFKAAFSSFSSKGERSFSVVLAPSANLFLNGQFHLLQDHLIDGISSATVSGSAAKHWSGFVSTRVTGSDAEIRFPEFKPYGTVHRFSKKPDGKWVAIPPAAPASEQLDVLLRAFWVTAALPDSMIAPEGVTPPESIVFQSDTRKQSVSKTMSWSSFSKWLRSAFPEVLPVYYGTMQPLKRENDRLTTIGSWSLVDPHLKMEHLFKVTQTIEQTDAGVSFKHVTIQATFGVRLDNVENLYGTTPGKTQADFPPFTIDVRKKKQ
jgi:hypothetical protein